MTKILCFLGILLSVSLCVQSWGMYLSWLYIPWVFFIITAAFIAYNIGSEVYLKEFYLRPSIICLLSLLIVGFQLSIDDVLGYSSLNSTIFSGASEYADQAFFSASLFVFSYILGLGQSRNILFRNNSNDTNAKHAKVWLGIMLLTFVLFISTIDVRFFLSGEVYHGSGAADYNYSITNTLEGLYQIFFYVTLACYVKLSSIRGKTEKSFRNFVKEFPLLFWVCVISYLFLRLLSGDRGPIIYNSLAIIYGFIWCTKYRFKLLTVVGCLIVGALFMSFMSTFRSRDSNMSISEKISETTERRAEMDDKSVFSGTKELALSENTHFIAIKDIAKYKTNYSFGKYALFSICSAIPGLKKQYLYDLGFESTEISSADYFTISCNGKDFTHGEGSSMFGEAYLEFGVIGMIILGLLLGSIFKQLDIALMSTNSISVISLAVILQVSAKAIYMGRTSFAIELSYVLHMIVITCIINFVLKKLFL